MGYGVAEASLKDHASKVIVVSSDPERVKKTIKRLQAGNFGHGVIEGEAVDAKDPVALKEFILRVGEVDHIVYTSGDNVNQVMGFPNVTLEASKAAFDVRFWGPVVIAQNAKFKPGGSLTLTSGIAHKKPIPGVSILTGVLGGIESFCRGLAVDLAPIRVNSIRPGPIMTELFDQLPKEMLEGFVQNVKETSLIKRVGEPAEVAEAYLFVMKCGYITGQSIEVDGGRTLV